MSAPKFQHRHYAPLAEILHRHSATYARQDNVAAGSAVASLVHELERVFAVDNEHFDRARWREACAGTPQKKDARTAAKTVQA